MAWAGAFRFLQAAMSEPPVAGAAQGIASFSRIAAGFIIAFVLMWVTYLVFKTHAMPDLAGPTLFMTGGASATYGANRVVTAIQQNSKDNSDTNVANATANAQVAQANQTQLNQMQADKQVGN